MPKNNKAAGCGDTQAAQLIIFAVHFNRLALAFKAWFFRAATWLSMVVGGLC